jgi:hypothetical protein
MIAPCDTSPGHFAYPLRAFVQLHKVTYTRLNKMAIKGVSFLFSSSCIAPYESSIFFSLLPPLTQTFLGDPLQHIWIIWVLGWPRQHLSAGRGCG